MCVIFFVLTAMKNDIVVIDERLYCRLDVSLWFLLEIQN